MRTAARTPWFVAAVLAGSPLPAAPLPGDEAPGETMAATAIAEPKRDAPVDFTREVLPVLKRRCLACHHRTNSKGGLSLETPASLLAGGRKGPAALPGKGAESLAVLFASRARKPYMPPLRNQVGAEPMTPEDLGLMKRWIDEGARGGESASSGSTPAAWRQLPAGFHAIYAAAVTDDGLLAACGRANRISIYNVAAGRLAARPSDPSLAAGGLYAGAGAADIDGIQALAFRPDGGLLAAGGYRTVKLWRRPAPRRLVLPDAGSAVRALVADAGGTRLAAGTDDGKLQVWELPSGRPLRSVGLHAAPITGLRFFPDGERLCTGSLDGTIAAIDTGTGAVLGRIATGAPVRAIALAAPGARVVAAGADGALRVWAAPGTEAGHAPQPEPLAVLTGHARAVTALDAAPGDGMKIVSGGEDGTVRLWDLAAGKEVGQVNHGAPVAAVAARLDGEAFASVGADRAAKLWKADGGLIAELKGDFDACALLARRTREAERAVKAAGAARELLAKAESRAAEAAKMAAEAKAALDKLLADQAAAAEPAKAGAAAKTPAEAAKAAAEAEAARKRAEEASGLAASAEKAAAAEVGPRKAGLESTEAARQGAESTRDATARIAADAERPLLALAFTPDGLDLAAGDEAGAVRLASAADGAPVAALRGHAGAALSLACIANAGIAAGASDGTVTVWQLDGDWPLDRVLGSADDPSTFADRVTAIAFSPDGALLAAGGGEPSRSGEVKVFRSAGAALALSLAGAHADVVLGLEFSPDGRFLATASADRFVKVHETATGKLVWSLEGHANHVLGVSWREDGQLLASAGADGVIKVWSMESGEQTRTIGGFGKQVTAIRFARGPQVVSASGDGTVRLHDAGSGAQTRSFPGAADYMHAVAVTPDGGMVLAGGHTGILHVWEGTKGEVLRTFKPPEEGK